MRLILWFLIMCSSEIVLAETKCFEIPAGLDGAALAGMWALFILASRGASEGIGWVVARYGTGAGRAVAIALQALRLLGWFFGKVGWGQPENEAVKQLLKPKPDAVDSKSNQ